MGRPEQQYLITCEHGGHRIPKHYEALFRHHEHVLASHRGWDPGALDVARRLARALDAESILATTSRLLVDLNRSPHNPRLFSEFTRDLSRRDRDRLLALHHQPHWARVRAAVATFPGRTLHIAVHSFVPVLQSVPRHFAAGILYDPGRRAERTLARRWQERLGRTLGPRQVRRNAPYRGVADGLPTALRRGFAAPRYIGLELELNQDSVATAPQRRSLAALLAETLRESAQPRLEPTGEGRSR